MIKFYVTEMKGEIEDEVMEEERGKREKKGC